MEFRGSENEKADKPITYHEVNMKSRITEKQYDKSDT